MSVARNLDLKQHFTDASAINSTMCSLLGDVTGATVLEPCVGHGALLQRLRGVPKRVDAIDIDVGALNVALEKYKHLKMESFAVDFIDLFVNSHLHNDSAVLHRTYDAVIANPPYGLFLDREYRAQIKSLFPHLYARESYGLFFAFALSLVRPGGRYVFLIPDTFLTSVNHKRLREFIVANAAPTTIIRFPSKLFETVNFGYGNLCIISGQKKCLAPSDAIQWLEARDQDELNEDSIAAASSIPGCTLITTQTAGWSANLTRQTTSSFSDWPLLGALAECRTGIYTGDNERFIGYDAHRVTRRLNGHSIDWSSSLQNDLLSDEEKQSGVASPKFYVPLIRGGHRGAFDCTPWAIQWSTPAVSYYKSDKKARFQNSAYYFRDGISVPMVTSKRISAALMSNAVFDQGVVGIFPNAAENRSLLLLYLNSTFASVTLKQLVNGSANNSANYIKRLVVPPFTHDDALRASAIVERCRAQNCLPTEACDTFVASLGAALPVQV